MTDQILRIGARIERIQAKLDRLKGLEPTEKRLHRIANQEAKLLRQTEKYTLLIEQLPEGRVSARGLEVEAQNIELPVDTFEFSYRKVQDAEGDDLLLMVDVDVYDSPFDDTFTGGEPLMVRSSATTVQVDPVTGKSCGGKTTTSSAGLTHVWEGGNRETISFGDSLYLDWENFREVTVTLAKNDEEWRDGGPLNFPVAEDTFLVADVFPLL